MIYSKLTNPKHSTLIKMLALFVLFSFSITSCVTYYSKEMTPQNLDSLNNSEIGKVTKIVTKDSVIDATPYHVWYNRDQSSLILEKYDSIHYDNSITKAYKLKKTLTELKLSDVYKISTLNSEFSFGKTMMWAGIAVGAVLVIAIIAIILKPPRISIIKFN